ncbi:unnamed protein product [Enterobius vermicularis]|uniref:Gustatory receptor n=1 Tax=Enterobius vermicularis TaxID=51028 RepID=A0A0N4VHD5_ENTVE|nr:unnamed protein product [Enterobius vermicularis]
MLTCAYLLLVLVVGFLLEISHIFNKNDEIMNAVGLKDLVSIFYKCFFYGKLNLCALLVFGLFGVVYCGLLSVLCMFEYETEGNNCSGYTIGSTLLAMFFIFIQMHFVFCNSSIVVHGSLKIARLGMMHLVATNLWTWIKYILVEEELMYELHETPVHLSAVENEHNKCKVVACVLGSFTEFMYTCIVEYSLICATVCFVFWTNIGKEISKRQLLHNVIAIDLSSTTTGLFSGFVLVAVTFVSITIFNTYASEHHMKNIAYMVFYLTTLSFVVICFAAVLLAFHRMRRLKFIMEEEDIDEGAELLDRLLLVFGLTGELIFCIGGIMSLAQSLANGLVTLLLFNKCLSLIQVLSQSALILIGSKLKASSKEAKKKKPGKQVMFFLTATVLDYCCF